MIVRLIAQGTTSNGRALLPWIADLSKLPDNQRMHLIALKYTLGGGGFSPTLPTTGIPTLIRFFLNASRQVRVSFVVLLIGTGSGTTI